MTETILSKQEVKKLLHFKSDTSLYNLEKHDHSFPNKLKIGIRRIGYKSSEIYAWLETRKVRRDEVA